MKNEEFYYLVFVLGYDLMQEEFSYSGCPCDTAFGKAKDIIKDFEESEYYQDNSKSIYECLQDYLKTLKENNKHKQELNDLQN